MKARLAFVVQRYGLEVVGGAETLTRRVAERLANHYEVEAISTCAVDYTSWNNAYMPGDTVINDVLVHRFRTDHPRHRNFDRLYADLLANRSATVLDEIEWLKAQGPYSTDLLQYLGSHCQRYDMLVFVGYLYFHTYFGLQVAPQRSIIIPTTHDEPPLYFDVFNTVFLLPRAWIFLSPEEQQLVHRRFGLPETVPQAVIGGGVDLPQCVHPDAFRARYHLDGPFILYAGRVDTSKQCDILFEWFLRYRKDKDSRIKLVCIGKLHMSLPPGDAIQFLGTLSEDDKFAAMAGATAFIMPSTHESFSIATLEALGMGTPVIANASSEVVRGHCVRSNGGLYYRSYDEFTECLALLIRQSELRDKLGENGRAYVQANYSWEIIEQRYVSFLEAARGSLWT